MTTSDAFALKNSGLGAFLFAEVGTELNGSPLTILSILARSGQDPWAEAAKWAKLPKATIVDRLAESIARMPLMPQALAEARATAARLVLLLPAQVSRPAEGPVQQAAAMPKWVLVAICCAALALGFGFNFMSGGSSSTAITPIADLKAQSQPAPGASR